MMKPSWRRQMKSSECHTDKIYQRMEQYKMKNKLKKITIILTVGFLILNIGFIGSESKVMPYAEVGEEHDAEQF